MLGKLPVGKDVLSFILGDSRRKRDNVRDPFFLDRRYFVPSLACENEELHDVRERWVFVFPYLLQLFSRQHTGSGMVIYSPFPDQGIAGDDVVLDAPVEKGFICDRGMRARKVR